MKSSKFIVDGKNQVLKCLECNISVPLPLPMEVSLYLKWQEDQIKEHECDESEEDAQSRMEEEAHENQMSDFYGGSQPVTLKEQMEEARKLK